ncbi:hypothetical protein OSH11_23685 [Kaistia dalseonensis]|uniref:Large-conductance mechanosensitive channel n=1 Tax=Kaistia dalseonensis TaxID=410840 RepID=A0ABU0HF54_9HYPH|nr:hypothetical protein [Kaistia dalseonensis]MCX5497721.1 hypothetical protein [Kaistia dalseonensis]MDQ0440365.1 large-conductance mechanosensitive channel [Kaistia dalseonensis]
MSGLLEALASIATATAAQATVRTLRHFAWSALAALFILVGIGFTASAGFEALVMVYGSLAAKLIVAAVFLIIGLVIFIAMAISKNQRRRQAPASSDATASAIAFAIGLMGGMGRRR